MHVYTLTNTRLIQTAETHENKEFHVQNSSSDLCGAGSPFYSHERADLHGRHFKDVNENREPPQQHAGEEDGSSVQYDFRNKVIPLWMLQCLLH